jgi:transcriptional regulator
MYIPAKYLEENWEYQKEVITNHPLATVITFSQDGLIANHIPFVLAIDRETGKKYLHAHVAKKNHQIPALVSSEEVLVVFKSADSYITPTYYPTKQETHKVVPTWDFAAVHCYGKATIIDRKEWVRAQLDELTSQQEKERDVKWTVDEAPESHVNTLQKAICGLMIEITRIESKFKFEQKMPEQDVDGTIEGLAIDGKHEVSAFVKKCNHAS